MLNKYHFQMPGPWPTNCTGTPITKFLYPYPLSSLCGLSPLALPSALSLGLVNWILLNGRTKVLSTEGRPTLVPRVCYCHENMHSLACWKCARDSAKIAEISWSRSYDAS